MKKYFLIGLLILSTPLAIAQEDGPPQEPPYIDDSAEAFEDELDLAEEAASEEAPLIPVEPETYSNSVAEEFELLEEDSKASPIVETPQNATDFFEEELNQEQAEEIVYEPQKVPQQEVIVERSSKGGYDYIKHPLAAKGLTEIRQDGSYIYNTSEKINSNSSGAFRIGMMDAPRITAADGTTFEMMYSEGQQPFFNFDFEWQPFKSVGRLGLTGGFGLLIAQGQGRFLDPSMAAFEAKESYTFVAIPVSLGLNYRFQFADRQVIVPYMTGGVSYYGVIEYRDDGKTKAVGTPGGYGGGGILLNISGMSREAGFALNNEYGIANLYVSLDYKYTVTASEDLDFSSHMIGAGIVADY